MIYLNKESELITIVNNFDINLKEIDPYTCYAFEELQNERFSNKLDYYLCVVKDDSKTYLLDASRFIKDCLHHNCIVDNPLTRIR